MWRNLTVAAVVCAIGGSMMPAVAAPIMGSVEVESLLGQHLALKMHIGDETTRFELTGPDYSWFAFAFDTTTMQGYSLVIQGLDGNRTAVEQNLRGIGDPGFPQATQNIVLVDTQHDAANDLTTVILERPNVTSDPNDPDFSTSMMSLDLVWAYDGFASPNNPNGVISYHGPGRGLVEIEFTPEMVFACGDLDRDVDVDIADVLSVLGNWTGALEGGVGDESTFAMGDCDLDSDIDIGDFLQVLGNWTGSLAGANVKSVPEPAGLSLLALGLLSATAALRRRSRP